MREILISAAVRAPFGSLCLLLVRGLGGEYAGADLWLAAIDFLFGCAGLFVILLLIQLAENAKERKNPPPGRKMRARLPEQGSL